MTTTKEGNRTGAGNPRLAPAPEKFGHRQAKTAPLRAVRNPWWASHRQPARYCAPPRTRRGYRRPHPVSQAVRGFDDPPEHGFMPLSLSENAGCNARAPIDEPVSSLTSPGGRQPADGRKRASGVCASRAGDARVTAAERSVAREPSVEALLQLGQVGVPERGIERHRGFQVGRIGR